MCKENNRSKLWNRIIEGKKIISRPRYEMKDILLSCSPLGEFIGTKNSHDIAKIYIYVMSYCVKKCIIPMHTGE